MVLGKLGGGELLALCCQALVRVRISLQFKLLVGSQLLMLRVACQVLEGSLI
jgi:hypothetical protein